MIEAGELRHIVTIQQNTGSTKDAGGQETINWGNPVTVWAKIETLSGRALEIAHGNWPTASHKITMRYVPISVTANRLVFGERIFRINSVNNVEEKNIELQITVTEALK